MPRKRTKVAAEVDSPRRAYWCEEKHPPNRVFLRPGQAIPNCPTCSRKMTRQENRPYFGKEQS